MFRKLLKFPKHGSRKNIKYGYKKTLLPFETASPSVKNGILKKKINLTLQFHKFLT